MPNNNYIQLKVPVENADIVFDALCDMYGMPLTETKTTTTKNEDGEDVTETEEVELDKESQARKALIGIVNNAVVEYRNRQALKQVQDNQEDLNIT